jgi:DMSO/TMAO reductase YedYZ molybdopterin-dependent catalytic subunit
MATWAIDNIGHRAQSLLGWTFIGGTLVLGYLLGRRPAWLLAGFALALTLIAGWLDPLVKEMTGTISSAIVAAITAFVAGVSFQRIAASEPGPEVDWGRRRFMARAGLGVLVVGVAGTAALREGSRSTPRGVVRADEPAAVPMDASFPNVEDISPRVTSSPDHYVVDIDLDNPMIGMSGWRLEVDGAVTTPLSLSLAELQAMETKERINNLSCISNTVGGDLISNSRWTGVPLDALLAMAQPNANAITLVAHSYDGFTDGIPLAEIQGKDALIAFGMNGELLPRDHGFPARLLFPNHYGMRNVKWLTRLELKTEDEEGYWAQRGWDREAVTRTESRFDTPRNGNRVPSRFVCGGIAWAGARGIQKVEVSTDDGASWQEADLEEPLGALSWRRWQIALELPPGEHKLAVRATDGKGTPQDVQERDPHPSGASGYHRVGVTVTKSA